MMGVALPPPVANEVRERENDTTTRTASVPQAQPSDDRNGVHVDATAQSVATVSVLGVPPPPDAGSASPPTTVVSFVSPSGSSGASITSGSSSSSLEKERLFRQLGVSILILQGLSTMAFCTYAFHIENHVVINTTTSIFHPWCVITCWIMAVPYAENSVLFRVSWVIFMVSIGSVFLVDGRMFGQEPSKSYAMHLPVAVLVVSVFWGMMERVAQNVRRRQQLQQWQLNTMALASLDSSWKASLILVYLLATAIGGLGGRSIDEIQNASELLQYDATISSKGEEEELTLTYLNDKIKASQVMEDYLDTLRANTAGSLLNMYLVFSFVLVSVAHVSTVDVLQRRVTLPEGMALAAMLLLVMVTLIYLGVTTYYHGMDSPTEVVAIFVSMITLVIILICCERIAHSIGRNTNHHPYFGERQRRVDYIQQYRMQQGLHLPGGEDMQ